VVSALIESEPEAVLVLDAEATGAALAAASRLRRPDGGPRVVYQPRWTLPCSLTPAREALLDRAARRESDRVIEPTAGPTPDPTPPGEPKAPKSGAPTVVAWTGLRSPWTPLRLIRLLEAMDRAELRILVWPGLSARARRRFVATARRRGVADRLRVDPAPAPQSATEALRGADVGVILRRGATPAGPVARFAVQLMARAGVPVAVPDVADLASPVLAADAGQAYNPLEFEDWLLAVKAALAGRDRLTGAGLGARLTDEALRDAYKDL
jgi:hypothetical protein